MQRITSGIQQFLRYLFSSGVLLITVTVISLLLANSSWGVSYLEIFEKHFGFENGVIHLNETIRHWINDGLMAIFFLLVGLEIKRELLIGELSTRSKSMLPFIAAIGGMLIPALIYNCFNAGTNTSHGWGVPMATDIAFALAILAMVGNKVPIGLKIFLTALAIIDDLGAILVIAFFYTSDLNFNYLLIALVPVAILFFLNKTRNQYLLFYSITGIVLWYCVLKSGVHATIAGIVLAFFIPLDISKNEKNGYKVSPLERLENSLHGVVNIVILPLFALANTALVIEGNILSKLTAGLSLGVMFGLFIGKPIGITFFSWLAVKTKIAALPTSVNWRHIFGAGVLGGIGFTMSIFISMLAFKHPEQQDLSKIAILIASFFSGVIGFVLIKRINVE